MKLSKKLIINLIEGALFAENKPMSLEKLRNLLPKAQRPPLGELRALMEDIQKQYATRGVHLVEVASGFRFQVAPHVTEHLLGHQEEKPMRFSKAFMETLALVAYRQPITRGEIEDIRGVAVSSNIIKTLQELEWVREVGVKDVPGKPALLATTKKFLDYFNLKSLEALPPLAELEALTETRLEEDLPKAAVVKEGFIGPLPGPIQDAPEVEHEQLEIQALKEKTSDPDFEVNDEAEPVAHELDEENIQVETEQDASNHRPLDEFSEIVMTHPVKPPEEQSGSDHE